MQEFPVQVRRIEYRNPYDFTREHRHDYFEIFFFESGGGSQLIDFVEYPVIANSSYIVFPQQIHLLKRAPEACGQLVQFKEEVIPSPPIRLLLRQYFFGGNPAIVFENDRNKIEEFFQLLYLLQKSTSEQSQYRLDIALHHLQALILQLLSNKISNPTDSITGERKLLFDFQNILEEQFPQNHSVSKYATSLGTTEKKLSAVTKKFLGLSPLQVIHNRILLEARRMLLFEDTSHKEISFQLGFDSPASFSLFIRNKTGFSPSELSSQLVNIHK
jgi:AraC-like DNA-binding protein